MGFLAAGEILGETTRVRHVTIKDAPGLPDGEYAFVDSYCTDVDCDCRKSMIRVHLGHQYVSLINYGWESTSFYDQWYGRPCDAQTLKEMQGPSIDLSSPNLVSPTAMLEFFKSLLDEQFKVHFQQQYMRFRAALSHPPTRKKIESFEPASDSSAEKICRNEPCPCGSGKKFKRCCGSGN